MTKYDYLIIGGGIAGVTAAETIRGESPDASIGIVSDEPYPPYSRVLLPAFLKRKISREQLFLRKVDDFTARRIDLRLKEEVVYVDIKRREAGLSNRNVLGYDKLLIASGGKVVPWGKDEEQAYIYRLQTLDDADRLFKALEVIKNPLVIGASFISLEFLEIFLSNSIIPTLLVRDTHFFSRILDEVGGELLYDNFEQHGIRLQFNDEVGETVRHGSVFTVTTKGLRQLEVDAFAVGVGLERNIGFLTGSGIELGKQGIRTNEFLETNEEGVFAAGDVAEFFDVISGVQHVVGNWTNSFLQGKQAGLNMTGRHEPYKKVPSYSLTNLGFQLTALGDCSNNYDTVSRLDRSHRAYERFFLKKGILIGAALINRFQDKSYIAKLIENKVNVQGYQDKLSDFEFDIQEIPA